MRPQFSPTAYRRITLFALLALGFIVVTGAAVRLTGSGLGCSTWPNCEPSSLVPTEASGNHGWIEFVNRLITGLVSVAVVLAVLGSRWRTPRRRDLTRWSWALVAGVAAQVVLGGITVLTHLTPPVVMAHFLLSAVLVACAVVLHHRAGEPDGGERRSTATPEVARAATGIVALAAAVLVTGTAVTGAGPHGGDADVERLDIALTDITRIHTIAVWVLVALTVWTFFRVRRGAAGPAVEGALRVLLVVVFVQGFVGYTQYFAGVPQGLVLSHIVGSMLVLGAAVYVRLRCTVVEPVPSGRRERAAVPA